MFPTKLTRLPKNLIRNKINCIVISFSAKQGKLDRRAEASGISQAGDLEVDYETNLGDSRSCVESNLLNRMRKPT